MIKLKIYLACIAVLVIVFFLNGCASTTDTLRYGEKTEPTNENNSSIKFALKDTCQTNDLSDIETKDTSYTIDDSSDPDEIPVNKNKIDISSLLKKYVNNNPKNELTADQLNDREKILMEIIKYLDTPYRYGGNTKNGIDCSAFTKTVYSQALSINLERSARDQYHEGEVVPSKDDLQFGDLIFFNTRRRVKPGHVGIYIGDDLFAHASSKIGVTVSSLDEEYYAKRYIGARRFENLSGSGVITGKN